MDYLATYVVSYKHIDFITGVEKGHSTVVRVKRDLPKAGILEAITHVLEARWGINQYTEGIEVLEYTEVC